MTPPRASYGEGSQRYVKFATKRIGVPPYRLLEPKYVRVKPNAIMDKDGV